MGTQTYGHAHKKLRAKYAKEVAADQATCARCGQPIRPDQPWDLGHDDARPGEYSGPEHQSCNRRAGGDKRWREPKAPRRWAL